MQKRIVNTPVLHEPISTPAAQAKAAASPRHAQLTELAGEINASPRMLAQRKQLPKSSVPVATPGKKEKVPLQGKFDGAQLQASAKKKTAQRQMDPAQLKTAEKKKKF